MITPAEILAAYERGAKEYDAIILKCREIGQRLKESDRDLAMLASEVNKTATALMENELHLREWLESNQDAADWWKGNS